jgi:AraC-like DNA-binding protein
VHYLEVGPGPALGGRVLFWRLTGAAESEPEPVLPDGCVEIVVHLGDPFRIACGGRWEVQPRVLLAGPGTRPVRLLPGAHADVIGARIEAGGAARLAGGGLEALVDRIVALDDVAPSLARGLVEELSAPRPHERWTDVLERRLAAALAPPSPAVARAVALLRSAHGRTSVDELASAVGLSPRQLERRFRVEVGVGPKMLARIARFQHAWRLTERAPTLASVAARAGYFDQAHMVRDFQRFAGAAPGRFLAARPELARHFSGAVGAPEPARPAH